MPIMSELSDILLGAGAMGAGLYCFVLSRRLRRFTDLERGVGGAVAVLSAQVDDLTLALERARAAAEASVGGLARVSGRAEAAGQRLELLMASLHDLPVAGAPPTGVVSAALAEPASVPASDPAGPTRREPSGPERPAPETSGPESPIFLRHPATPGRSAEPGTVPGQGPRRIAGTLPSPPARIAGAGRPPGRTLGLAS